MTGLHFFWVLMCYGIQSKEQPHFFGEAVKPQHVRVSLAHSVMYMWESSRSLILQQLGRPGPTGDPPLMVSQEETLLLQTVLQGHPSKCREAASLNLILLGHFMDS